MRNYVIDLERRRVRPLPPHCLHVAAATEIMPIAEANSLLIRCENSRSSNRASDEYCPVDELSVVCIMLHPIEAPAIFSDKTLTRMFVNRS